MSHMTAVVLAMIGLPLVYIVIDIFLAINKREGDTYSEILRKAGQKFQPLVMMICFGFGLLAGHWWW